MQETKNIKHVTITIFFHTFNSDNKGKIVKNCKLTISIS